MSKGELERRKETMLLVVLLGVLLVFGSIFLTELLLTGVLVMAVGLLETYRIESLLEKLRGKEVLDEERDAGEESLTLSDK